MVAAIDIITAEATDVTAATTAAGSPRSSASVGVTRRTLRIRTMAIPVTMRIPVTATPATAMGIPITPTTLTMGPMATRTTTTPATDMESVMEATDTTVEAIDTIVAERIPRLRSIKTGAPFITATTD